MSSSARPGSRTPAPTNGDPPSDVDSMPGLTAVSDSSDDEYVLRRNRAATIEDDHDESSEVEYADDDDDSAWETESESEALNHLPGRPATTGHSPRVSRNRASPDHDLDDLPTLLSVSDSDVSEDEADYRPVSPVDSLVLMGRRRSESNNPTLANLGALFRQDPDQNSDDEDSNDPEDDLDVATAAARYAVRRRRPLPTPFNLLQNLNPAQVPQPDAFVPDIERAKGLVDGLEPISQDLLLRYKIVQGGEDDAILCAICHDSLVQEAPGSPSSSTAPVEGLSVHSLPCRHLFHTQCITPWFGIKSTCPTCRFDLDPHSHFRSHPEPAAAPFISSREDLEAVLQVLGQSYWSRVTNPSGRDAVYDSDSESDDENDEMPALEPISSVHRGALQHGDEDDEQRIALLESMQRATQTSGRRDTDEWDTQMPALEAIEERTEPSSRPNTRAIFIADPRPNPPSLLTPISSRAQTLESPVGEQLSMDQIRWPPGRSNSIGSPNTYQPDPQVLDIHGPRLLREAITRRSLMHHSNVFQASPPTSVLSLGGSTTRASTMPEVSGTSDAHTEAAGFRRSYTIEGQGARSTPHTSPRMNLMTSRLSPQTRSPELVPVAPLLGVLQALPPISPDQATFPHGQMQEEPEEAPVGAWDYLTPSAGVSSAGLPSDREMRGVIMGELERILPRQTGQVNGMNTHEALDQILLDSPPQRMASPLSPTHGDNAFALQALSETFRRLRTQANLTTPPLDTDGRTPESFTFGTTAPREVRTEEVAQPPHTLPTRKWVRPPGQSFVDYVQECEAAVAREGELDLMGVD